MLAGVIKRSAQRAELAHLFGLWPSLELALLRLTRQITDWPPGRSKACLLAECLNSAFAALDHEIYPPALTTRHLAVFLRGLLEPAPQLFSVQIWALNSAAAERGDFTDIDHLWTPLGDPLHEWLSAQTPQARIRLYRQPYPSIQHGPAREVLASRILDVHDIRLLGGDLSFLKSVHTLTE
jgi:hypothetical protein